ncbi:DAAM2 [Branchiostoma lanceolatum]|uniref:DAAM2 protein n=1 Tax=Branchiostoma lanceolatum TaxID=7740 RepID=A0A8J9ZST7_BRALA|nr:DAAM2 [Branchiostoma lanceolatum]
MPVVVSTGDEAMPRKKRGGCCSCLGGNDEAPEITYALDNGIALHPVEMAIPPMPPPDELNVKFNELVVTLIGGLPAAVQIRGCFRSVSGQGLQKHSLDARLFPGVEHSQSLVMVGTSDRGSPGLTSAERFRLCAALPTIKSADRSDELDLTAPYRQNMLNLPPEKKWQLYCSKKRWQREYCMFPPLSRQWLTACGAQSGCHRDDWGK